MGRRCFVLCSYSESFILRSLSEIPGVIDMDWSNDICYVLVQFDCWEELTGWSTKEDDIYGYYDGSFQFPNGDQLVLDKNETNKVSVR